MSKAKETHRAPVPQQIDVVIVGAGFGGMYMLHRLRGLGMSAIVFDVAGGVGGTGTGTATPAPGATSKACNTPTRSRKNCSRNGSGARCSPVSRRSCVMPTMSPIGWTCGVTCGSRPG